jgi:hypothetical protein
MGINPGRMSNAGRKWIEVTVILATFLFLHARYLFLDLWNDELYTLEHFVFVPKLTTITDYHVPNNHVFANLVFGVWTQLLGIHGIHDILEHPWILRFFLAGISAVGVLLIYVAGERLQRHAGFLAALVLCFTVPFLNFSTQVRGYSISMMLVAGLLWLVGTGCTWRTLGLITLAASLLAYSIPSNYPVLLGFVAGLGFCFFIHRAREWLLKSVAVLIGVSASLLLYSPILSDVFRNEYVASFGHFRMHVLTGVAPTVLEGFMGYRYVLTALVMLGMLITLRHFKRNRALFGMTIMTICVIVGPFLTSFVRGDDPPHRTFVVLAPAVAMFAGVSMSGMVGRLRRLWLLVPLLIVAEGTYHVMRVHKRNEAACLRGIRHDYRPQDLVTNYFQYRYEPLRSVRTFTREHGRPFVLIHHCEPHDIRHYLDHYGMSHVNMEGIDSMLLVGDPFYTVTSHPWLFMWEVSRRQPAAQVDFLRPERISYHNFMEVLPASDKAQPP